MGQFRKFGAVKPTVDAGCARRRKRERGKSGKKVGDQRDIAEDRQSHNGSRIRRLSLLSRFQFPGRIATIEPCRPLRFRRSRVGRPDEEVLAEIVLAMF